MNSIAFLFMQSPYGNSSSREGLDVILTAVNFIKKISIFFIGDGVLQVINNQKPEKILAFNHTKSFGILSIYEIQESYICYESLKERGINIKKKNTYSNKS